MFRRRNPLPLLHKIAEFFWPARGWSRASRYVAHRLGRLPGTPYRIAAGFACGAAVSFTPFIGLHFLLAALLSLTLRAHVVASAIGTVIGNPWTFPFIWTWIYTLGRWILGDGAADDLPAILTLTYIFDRPLAVLLPMTVGGVPMAIVTWFGVYFPVRALVAHYQKARRRRLRKKVLKRMERTAERARASAAASRVEARP